MIELMFEKAFIVKT